MEEDELWDYYSGLPNPLWYQKRKELEDEEENTIDSNNTASSPKQNKK